MLFVRVAGDGSVRQEVRHERNDVNLLRAIRWP